MARAYGSSAHLLMKRETVYLIVGVRRERIVDPRDSLAGLIEDLASESRANRRPRAGGAGATPAAGLMRGRGSLRPRGHLRAAQQRAFFSSAAQTELFMQRNGQATVSMSFRDKRRMGKAFEHSEGDDGSDGQ
jgi:hypothetical protein